VIRLPPQASLTGIERYALDLLIDLARIPPVDDSSVDVVRLLVAERDAGPADLRTCIARDWYLERGDGTVSVPSSVLRRIGAVANATAERGKTSRDRYDRVPSTENELVQAGLATDPVVSRAAARLRDAVVASAGRRPVALATPWPEGKRWAAALTHDLDVVAYWPLFTLLRVAELARKGELKRVGRAALTALQAVGRDPVAQAVRRVLDDERALGIVSTWFVLCGTPTLTTMRAGDLTYRPEGRAARAIVGALTERGSEIGLHGSFATADREELFHQQRGRLERLVGHLVVGVRQHFLRMHAGVTHRGMTAAGFRYDSTCGFFDRNGFRLGIADVMPLWDPSTERSIGLEEAPFCWMDRTLSKYGGVEDPATWVADGAALAETCRQVEGLWVGVWHPNLSPPLGYPDAPDAFRSLLTRIVAHEPFLGTLRTMVEWRSARRSLRVRRLSPDGRFDAQAAVPPPAAQPLSLEDPSRRVIATVNR
jgi:hypothetical protein